MLLTSTDFKKLEDNFKSVDFNDKTKAIEKINDTVSNDTNKRIPKLIQLSNFTKENIPICLGNAATFEDRFVEPFDDRKPLPFYSSPPRTINMIHEEVGVGWSYNTGEDWTCLGIPYKSLERELYILLPKEKDGLENLIQSFDASMIKKYMFGGVCEAKATIPIFEIESRIILNEHLKEMGINKIFDPNSLSHLFSDDQLHTLDLILHSSKIQIDEYGTFAKPFHHSGSRCLANYPQMEFKADHPFIFFVAGFKSRQFNSIEFAGIFN